jgi:hypothetical protein
MMERWGLTGMRSFEQEGVARKEASSKETAEVASPSDLGPSV